MEDSRHKRSTRNQNPVYTFQMNVFKEESDTRSSEDDCFVSKRKKLSKTSSKSTHSGKAQRESKRKRSQAGEEKDEKKMSEVFEKLNHSASHGMSSTTTICEEFSDFDNVDEIGTSKENTPVSVSVPQEMTPISLAESEEHQLIPVNGAILDDINENSEMETESERQEMMLCDPFITQNERVDKLNIKKPELSFVPLQKQEAETQLEPTKKSMKKFKVTVLPEVLRYYETLESMSR